MSDSYQVLARKYRPQTFQDLLGQDVLVETLKNAIEKKRIPHAILLTGVRGIGKTTTARIISRALNCVGKDGKGSETIHPCGDCQPCVDILNERHLDVIEMDAASRTSVDDIRRVIEAAYYKPSSARYKIQIIDEVHMLTKQAFNALLKTLEEPPEYTKFIFATTELNRVPDTIISRCVRFDLKRFDINTLKDLLKRTCDQESIKIENDALMVLAQGANGSARDGQSLLERAISLSPGTIMGESVRTMMGLSGQGDILDTLHGILKGETAVVLKKFETLYQNGADPDQVLSSLCDLVHEISCLKISPSFAERTLLSAKELETLKAHAQVLSVPVLTRLWQVLTKGRDDLKNALTPVQAMDMILIRACFLSDLPTAQSVISSLANLKSPIAALSDSAEKKNSELEKIVPKKETLSPPSTIKKIPVQSAPKSFSDLVELFEANKEPLLKYELENHVHLEKYAPDTATFEIISTPDIVDGFQRKLKENLDKWTGLSWSIKVIKRKKTMTSETDEKPIFTLRDQKNKNKFDLMATAKKTLLVKKTLETFEGSELKDVKPLKD